MKKIATSLFALSALLFSTNIASASIHECVHMTPDRAMKVTSSRTLKFHVCKDHSIFIKLPSAMQLSASATPDSTLDVGIGYGTGGIGSSIANNAGFGGTEILQSTTTNSSGYLEIKSMENSGYVDVFIVLQ